MRKQFWIIILLAVILLPAVGQGQWLITTTQGEEYIGIVSYPSKDSVSVRTLDDKKLMLCRDSIQSTNKMKTRIVLQNADIYFGFVRNFDDKILTLVLENEEEIKIKSTDISIMETRNTSESNLKERRKFNHPYKMFGFTLGSPSFMQFVYGSQNKNNGYRVSVGYIGLAGGIQFNLLKSINKRDSFEDNFSVCFGITSGEYDPIGPGDPYNLTVLYSGLCYDVNWDGVFFEIGVAFGLELSPQLMSMLDPQLLFQVGYVHRFID